MKVRLSEQHLEEAKEIAEKRSKNASSTRILSPDSELIGALGEMAFEKLTGLKMDKEVYITGDAGYDFVLYERGKFECREFSGDWSPHRITIDVKSRSSYPEHLAIDLPPTFKADIYVLCVVTVGDFEDMAVLVDFIGWATAVNFLMWGKPVMFGKRKQFGLLRTHLWGLKVFTDRLKEQRKKNVIEGLE